MSALDDAVRKARKNPFLSMDRILGDPFVDDGYGEDEGERRDSARARQSARRNSSRIIAALNARLLKEQAFETARATDRKKQAMASFDAYHGLLRAQARLLSGRQRRDHGADRRRR